MVLKLKNLKELNVLIIDVNAESGMVLWWVVLISKWFL